MERASGLFRFPTISEANLLVRVPITILLFLKEHEPVRAGHSTREEKLKRILSLCFCSDKTKNYRLSNTPLSQVLLSSFTDLIIQLDIFNDKNF